MSVVKMIPAEDYSKLFRRLPGMHLILKANPPHFTILDFTDEQGVTTNSDRSTAIGKDLFTQFHAHPNDPNEIGEKSLASSLIRVIETAAPHKMSVRKHDMLFGGTNNLEERYWQTENIPVIGDDGKVEYIIHHAVDVTDEILLEAKHRNTEIEIANLFVILSKTHNAVVLADANEKVQWVNNQFINQFQLQADNVIGKTFLELLMLVTNTSLHLPLEQSIALRQPMACEVENTNNYGSWGFARLETQPIFSPSGELTAFFAMMTDISEIKKAENIILKNELRNRVILGNISEGITIMNPAGIVIEVSPSALKILEYQESELVGRYWPDFIHSDDLALVNQAFKDIVLNNPKRGVQFRFRLPDGSYKWMESTYHSNEPAIRGIVLTYRDITERKKQEELLLSSEQNYKYLFDNNPAAIFIWHPSTFKIIECNEAAAALSGYSKDELRLMTVFDYRPTEEHDRIWSVVQALQNVSFLNSVPSSLVTRSGEILNTENSYHKIKFYDQELILALVLNVTHKVKLERQIEIEKERKHFEVTDAVLTAQENERTHLGRELHDNINQILTTARLYIEYALAEEKMRIPLMESSRDFIKTAIKEVRELSKTLVPASLDENGLTSALEDLTKKVALLNTIEITHKYSFNDGQLSAKFRLAIFRIVQEQLNNIVKHSKASRASITIEQSATALILRVSDNGIGFDTAAGHDGLGFKNILSRATLHRGTVSISSAVGKGCELHIEFINPVM